MMLEFFSWLQDKNVPAEVIEEAKKKWIQEAIKHPGRCTKGSPNYDCPKGSPQYNLAKRFKKGGDLHKNK